MNMALMDIRELEPLARSLRRLLKQDGWLVLALLFSSHLE